MPQDVPVIITVKRNNIMVEGESVVIESNDLSDLMKEEKELGTRILNENGLNVRPEEIRIDNFGKVTIDNFELKEILRNGILNPDFESTALNVCGLCKVS